MVATVKLSILLGACLQGQQHTCHEDKTGVSLKIYAAWVSIDPIRF